MSDIMTEQDLADLEAMMNELGEEVEAPKPAKEPEQIKEVEVKAEKAPEPEPEPEPKKTDQRRVQVNSKPAKANVQAEFDLPRFSEQVRNDVAFNELTIQEDYMKQAALVAYYSTIAHRAAERLEKAKAKLDLVEALVDNELRMEAVNSGEKITEALVAKRIKLDGRYQAAQTKVIEARTLAGVTKDAMEALRHKRDMLIQVGADIREEMKGGLRMKGNS